MCTFILERLQILSSFDRNLLMYHFRFIPCSWTLHLSLIFIHICLVVQPTNLMLASFPDTRMDMEKKNQKRLCQKRAAGCLLILSSVYEAWLAMTSSKLNVSHLQRNTGRTTFSTFFFFLNEKDTLVFLKSLLSSFCWFCRARFLVRLLIRQGASF